MKALSLISLSLLLLVSATAGTKTSNGDGNWSSISWSPGGAPASGDDIVIRSQDVVSLSSSSITVKSLIINGRLNMNATGSTSRTLTVTGDLTIESGGTLHTNNQSSANTHTLNIGGNFVNNGTFVATDGSNDETNVVFNGSAASQSIGGTSATTFNDLQLNNSFGATLSQNQTIGGILTLTSGKITLGTDTLTIGTSGSISGASSSKYIVTNSTGVLTQNVPTSNTDVLFPIGPTASAYNPVTINNDLGTMADNFSVRVQAGFTGLVGPSDPNVVVNRAWLISEGAAGGSSAAITFQFNSGEFSLANFMVNQNYIARYNGSQWVTSAANETFPVGGPFTSSASGFTQFSAFGITSNTSALPIQLASFTGAYVNSAVRLNWSTVSEVNNYGFTIQKKSVTSTEWTEIENSFIPGHGTTNVPQHYSYTDNTTLAEATQYRLRQVDLDGTTSFTEPILLNGVTSVSENSPMQFALLQNYPNPFNPTTEIKFSVDATASTTLDVYNAIGQHVATLFNNVAESGKFYKVRFDAAGLASGMYFYRLTSGNKSDLKKLVLMK